jgi:hypothetical protein|tara:strand:- start:21577 stop:21861 length:285 start_codon:yes stop_codon:yes gene_type:complete
MSREKDLRLNIIEAGYRAVEQLIKVAKEDIIKPDPEDDLSADKLKNAAASKRLAIFDAFEILNKIEAEKATLEEVKDDSPKLDTKQGFAERRAK